MNPFLLLRRQRTINFYRCVVFILYLRFHVAMCIRRRCPDETLALTASVPCDTLRADGIELLSDDDLYRGASISCDYLVNGGVELAALHLNEEEARLPLLKNTSVQIHLLDGEDAIPLLDALGDVRRGQSHGVSGPASLDIARLFTPLITNQLQIPSVSYRISEDNIVESGLYFLTLPSNTYISNAIVSLLDHFQMFKTAVFVSGSVDQLQLFEIFTQDFTSHLSSQSQGQVDMAMTRTFSTSRELNLAIQYIAVHQIKTIVAFTNAAIATEMMCRASKAGLTSSEHSWILPAFVDSNWWLRFPSNCSREELLSALEGTIFVNPTKFPPTGTERLRHHPRDFLRDLINVTMNTFKTSDMSLITRLITHSRVISGYDSIWTIVKAWNSALSELDCTTEFENVTDKLIAALKQISDSEYEGMWNGIGCVVPTVNSQKYYGQVVFTQFQGGVVCPVAISLPNSFPGGSNLVLMEDTPTHPCLAIQLLGQWIRNFTTTTIIPSQNKHCSYRFLWKGGEEPPSSPIIIEDSKIPASVLFVMSVTAVVLMALAISVAIFNLKHRENKFVKATSPRLSLGITAGLVLLSPSTIVHGLTYSANAYSFSKESSNAVCWMDTWLSTIGTVLLYATLIVKNYRIYRIFHNKTLKIQRDDRLSDVGLLLPVFLLTLPMLVTGCISAVLDHHRTTIIPLDSGGDSINFLRLSYCKENKTLTGTLVAYLHLLVIPLIIFSLVTMRLGFRYGVEGRTAGAIALVTLASSEVFAGLYTGIRIESSGYAYLVYFYIYAVVSQLFMLAILAILNLPLYYTMYKERKVEAQRAVMSSELMEENKRVEHLGDLKCQAASLRRQLSEIDIKLEKISNRHKQVDNNCKV